MNLHYAGAAFIAIILVLILRVLWRIGRHVEQWTDINWEPDKRIDLEARYKRERERRRRDNES